ncbi:MAG: hypothetical protein KJO35_00115 [Gammaproteobacteria bacterium]|nr:hypothetical protein [Gammaproteobacteria bacterium]NNF67082.1 hypothetical protein [Gammaproteobacteria bacterium]
MFSRIAYSTDIAEFVLMTALLRDHGIEVLDMMRAGHVSIAGVDHGFYVQVPESQMIKARRWLTDSEFSHCVITEKTG